MILIYHYFTLSPKYQKHFSSYFWEQGIFTDRQESILVYLNVCVQVLLTRLSTRDAIARVIIGENVAVDPRKSW